MQTNEINSNFLSFIIIIELNGKHTSQDGVAVVIVPGSTRREIIRPENHFLTTRAPGGRIAPPSPPAAAETRACTPRTGRGSCRDAPPMPACGTLSECHRHWLQGLPQSLRSGTAWRGRGLGLEEIQPPANKVVNFDGGRARRAWHRGAAPAALGVQEHRGWETVLP